MDMNNTKHTPGPWYVGDDGNVWRTPTADRTGTNICDMVSSVTIDETQANGRLIAAAPELLEALESFLRAPHIGSSGPGSCTIEVQEFNLKAARAAIARAMGQS